MREFIDSMGIKYDLDDPETYAYLPKTYKELHNLMFQEIGRAHIYMYHIHKNMFCATPQEIQQGNLLEVCVDQRLKIEKLIKYFSENRKANIDNILWLQEQIFMFQNETDNFC